MVQPDEARIAKARGFLDDLVDAIRPPGGPARPPSDPRSGARRGRPRRRRSPRRRQDRFGACVSPPGPRPRRYDLGDAAAGRVAGPAPPSRRPGPKGPPCWSPFALARPAARERMTTDRPRTGGVTEPAPSAVPPAHPARGRGARAAAGPGDPTRRSAAGTSGRTTRARTPGAGQTERQTYFGSRNSSMPRCEPSRPRPDCLTPPKGASSVEMMPVLTPTIPYSSPSDTRVTRPRSRA